MKEPVCLFVEPETGERYRISIAPYERRHGHGVSRQLNTLVVETEDARWIGSVPVYRTGTLESLSEADLVELLDQAVAQG